MSRKKRTKQPQILSKSKLSMEISELFEERLDEQNILPLNSIISLSKKIYSERNDLNNYMSFRDVLGVVLDMIYDLVGSNQSRGTKLNDILDNIQKEGLTDNIINYFNSIPRSYTFVISMDNIVVPEMKVIKINDLVTLKFDKKHLISGGLFGQSSKDPIKYNFSLRVFINSSGYVSYSNYDVPYLILKQLIYLAISIDLFDVSNLKKDTVQTSMLGSLLSSDSNLQESPAKNNFFIDNQSQKETSITLAGHEIDFINKLEIKSGKINKLEDQISNLSKLFTALYSNTSVDNEKIKSAIAWCYESDIAANETFKFILKFIAIEALLGDQGRDKKYILSDRCAYLLAKNHVDRQAILSQMNELKDIRNKLVHGSGSHLQPQDKNQLSVLDSLLKRVITSELKMLR